jgi:pyrroloquinoline-quinone synthase
VSVLPTEAWTRDEFERQLRAQGSAYHIHHPFQVWMNEGRLTREQIQGWVANRYYYQISIPLKDAAILANCPDRTVRRAWIQRITDHDGTQGDEGGIERWLALGAAVGLAREELISQRRVLPGVRFAVDAYVQFARSAPWQEAVAASLTELFATEIHRQRLASWPTHYPWIDAQGLAYFRQRTQEAPRDVEHGLRLTLDHFTTRPGQDRVLEILRFKLAILWSLLDALWIAHVGYGADAPRPPVLPWRT